MWVTNKTFDIYIKTKLYLKLKTYGGQSSLAIDTADFMDERGRSEV